MTEYNTHQQVFALSLMSNILQTYKGRQADLQAAYETKLPIALKQLSDQWQVTWGPVVWKSEPDNAKTGPDHVWFVARNPSLKFADGQHHDTYVTAVAGTATGYNWSENNAGVHQVVDFFNWVRDGLVTEPRPATSLSPDGCYIAFGTARGVYRLATAAPPQSAASGGVTLPSYWASFPPSYQTKVIFTGHSLGAALSPTLALGLFDSLAFPKFSPRNILLYPTAGPSPGNWQFAQHLQATFPKITGPRYEVWNCNIVNSLDIVSQAWCTSAEASPGQNMNNIPEIYGTPAPGGVYLAVHIAKARADSSEVVYMPFEPLRFKGTPPSSTPSTVQEFMQVARTQHSEEFVKLFGIVIPPILAEEEDGVEKMTKKEVDNTKPIFRTIDPEASVAAFGPAMHNPDEILRGDFDMQD